MYLEFTFECMLLGAILHIFCVMVRGYMGDKRMCDRARRIVEAEAEEARLAAELELVKAEEAQKVLELESQQQQEALEHQLDIARRKLAAENESKRAETERALKVQVRQDYTSAEIPIRWPCTVSGVAVAPVRRSSTSRHFPPKKRHTSEKSVPCFTLHPPPGATGLRRFCLLLLSPRISVPQRVRPRLATLVSAFRTSCFILRQFYSGGVHA